VPNKFHTSSAKKLTLNQTPVIIVPGKAFFDVGHSLKEQRSNLRSHLPEYAAWEIHPVMKLESTYVVTLRQNCRRVGESRQPSGVDLISDALPFGRLWYGEPNAVSNAIGYAKFRSRSHDAVICVYREALELFPDGVASARISGPSGSTKRNRSAIG
jgi:hypothetical protein